MLLSKKERTKAWLMDDAHPTLRCIHCQGPLALDESSLVCPQQHRFDISRQGYVNLLKGSLRDQYSKELFQARRQVIEDSEFYQALHEALAQILMDFKLESRPGLDAGSGEASHLYQVCQRLMTCPPVIAMDITKDAVQMATAYAGDMLPVVGDLGNIPVMDASLGWVLSIFSPANYQEFKRILDSDGLLIKVLPNAGYLREIRQAIHKLLGKPLETYSNQEVYEHFVKQVKVLHEERVVQVCPLSDSDLGALVEMTPLTWQLSSEERQGLISKLKGRATLDVSILVGRFEK